MIKGFEHFKLPENWKLCTTKDIAKLINGDRGKNYPSRQHYVDRGIPFISAGNLNEGKILFDNLNYISKKRYDLLNNGKLIEGDIIYCIRGTLGKSAIFSNLENGAIASSLVIIRLREGINRKIFFYYLDSPFGKQLIKHFDNGTAQPNLSAESVSKYLIPLAPLPEQHCIVEKIEELFSELDNGIESLKKAREQLKTYRQAVLKHAFEGKLTGEWREQQIQAGNPPEPAEKLLPRIKKERETQYQKQVEAWQKACEQAKRDGSKKPAKPKKPKDLPPLIEKELAELPELPKGWRWLRFGQIVHDLKRGPFGSAIKKEFFVPKGIKVYEQKNAIYKSAMMGDYYISNEKFKELSGFEVKAGDYIVSCSGTIGKIYRLPKNAEKGVINQALLRIKISEKLLEHNFFLNIFESSHFQTKILKDTKGSAMPNLAGVKELELVPFAYCSLTEQEIIVQEIETRLSVCDKLEQTIEDSLKKAEALRQSILKKAFEGELTKEWREAHPELISGENSAESLLARIRTEKARLAGDGKQRQHRKVGKK